MTVCPGLPREALCITVHRWCEDVTPVGTRAMDSPAFFCVCCLSFGDASCCTSVFSCLGYRLPFWGTYRLSVPCPTVYIFVFTAHRTSEPKKRDF
jgi:hypothetical protein